MRMSLVVALSAAAFGTIITVGGVIFTTGTDRTLNVLGGLVFLIGSAMICGLGDRDPFLIESL